MDRGTGARCELLRGSDTLEVSVAFLISASHRLFRCSMTYPDFSRKLAIAAAWLACGAGAICAAQSSAPVPQAPAKIWTSPPGKLYVQSLTDRNMAAHPELLSMSFHGESSGPAPNTYTMFCGS